MYQALYRKYRPRNFDDVTGQSHITETLCGQVKAGRLSHAYLFVGTRGTGKTTCAKILARAVNCLTPKDGNPCNECKACKGIEDGTILDVLEIDAASNNGVDNIRELRDEAIYSPATVNKRVYILDEVHMLSTGAVNALLKILEEPPSHVLFVLATTELHKVPATIQSRCQRFSFKRLTTDEIASRLSEIAAKETLALEKDAAEKLAALADGSMRDGISLLDQCVTDKTIDIKHVQNTLGLATENELLDIVKNTAESKTLQVLEILDKLYKDGKNMTAVLDALTAVLRDLLIVRLDEKSTLLSSGIEVTQLIETTKQISQCRLLYCLEIAKNALQNPSRTGISKLILEICLIRMCDEKLNDSPSALATRIEKLETGGVTMPIKQPENQPERKPIEKPIEIEIPAEEPAEELTKKSAQEPLEKSKAEPAEEPKQTPTISDNDLLGKILENINDPGIKLMLSPQHGTIAELTGEIVIITLEDKANIKYISKDELNQAAKKALGENIQIRLE